MNKNKAVRNLQLMIDIREGKPPVRTTEKSAFNKGIEVNQPKHDVSRYQYFSSYTGRMLSQHEMGMIRRFQQAENLMFDGSHTQIFANAIRGHQVEAVNRG